ncbi:MAG: hypothetical protein IKR23_09820 [Lachnospiraceae bacterium]|nr:hypothetical protein [Lachnospiraceae bacterium]
MIDRVGNGNTYTPPYERGGKKAARVEGDAPAFLLPGEEQNGGVIWDRGPKDDIPRSAAQKQKKKDKEEYTPPITEQRQELEGEDDELKQSGFGKLLGRIGEAIKSFFLNLWYGGEKTEEKDPDAAEDTEPDVSSVNDSESRIRAAISSNDPDALMEELTEGGKKHPARNTSLLTHYDRRGRLVKPSDAEAGRILSAESTKKGKSGRNVERRPQGNYRRYI